MREAATSGGSAGARLQGVTQGASGGSDTVHPCLFHIRVHWARMGRDPARPGAEPLKGQREGVTFNPRNRQGRRTGKLFLHSRCQRDSLGLSPEQMEVGFPNQSTVTAQGSHHPGPMGGRIAKQSGKPTCTGGFRETGLTLLRWRPLGNRQWSYFLQ